MKQLHLVSTGKQTPEELVHHATAVHPLVDFIHLRERTWTAQAFLKAITDLTKNGVPVEKLVINDRVDVAITAGVPTVQLASHSIDVQSVKKHFPNLKVGCSVHGVTEAITKEKDGADFLIYGHVFETASKEGVEPRGIDQLNEVVSAVDIHVIAIGGMTLDRIEKIHDTNVSGIATLSGILQAENVKKMAKRYHDALKK
jgi:thiazole tautomerase (transcriptional regulator TenI)